MGRGRGSKQWDGGVSQWVGTENGNLEEEEG